MKKRRLTALLMAGVMAFGMMACGSSGEDKSSRKRCGKGGRRRGRENSAEDQPPSVSAWAAQYLCGGKRAL